MSSKAKKSKLIVLSAPSGSGKSTLASMLISRIPSIKLSISHTTRPPRGEEKNGTHYFFVDESTFKKMVGRNEFLEYAQVFQKHWYGTTKAFVESTLASGVNVLFDIDVQGAQALKKIYGKNSITVFLHPPSIEELERRLRNRKTENTQAIEIRLKNAKAEMAHAKDYDYELVNNDLEETYSALVDILKKENCI